MSCEGSWTFARPELPWRGVPESEVPVRGGFLGLGAFVGGS